jgi:hypothetical protein
MTVHTLMGPGGATEVKQDDILTALAALLAELTTKFQAGQEVALDAATLTALETITASVSNWPSDFPDAAGLAKAEQIRALLAATLTVAGTVALDASTLSALENINAAVTGAVSVTNFPANQIDALTDVELRAAPVPVSGPLTDAELRASDVNVADSGEREYTHVVATVTASGDNIIHTPAAGKAIRLRWIYAINKPTSSSSPLIKIKLGATEPYRVWALSKRQKTTGPVDGALVVNLDIGGEVAVTAILEEV